MNKDKRNNIKLLGTLNNADESGIIANANQVYDANENKSTQDVSKEHKERIETLETKESSMQTTLENITKTGEASAASNVTYNHNDSKLDATNVQQAVDEMRELINTHEGNIEELQDNVDEINKEIQVTDGLDDFSIQDEAGNVLSLWQNGQIRTKNFNSKDINQILFDSNDETTNKANYGTVTDLDSVQTPGVYLWKQNDKQAGIVQCFYDNMKHGLTQILCTNFILTDSNNNELSITEIYDKDNAQTGTFSAHNHGIHTYVRTYGFVSDFASSTGLQKLPQGWSGWTALLMDTDWFAKLKAICKAWFSDFNNIIISDGPDDFSVQDEAGNILCLWSKGHIRTKNFNSEKGDLLESDGKYIKQTSQDGSTYIKHEYISNPTPQINFATPLRYCNSSDAALAYTPTTNKFTAALIEVTSEYIVTIPYLMGIALDTTDTAYITQGTGDYPITIGLYDSSNKLIGVIDNTTAAQTNKKIDLRSELTLIKSSTTSKYTLTAGSTYYLYIQTQTNPSSVTSSSTTDDYVNAAKAQINAITIERHYIQDIQALDRENLDLQDNSNGFDLDVEDEEHNILVGFKNGHIKTKNFNSEKTLQVIDELKNDVKNIDASIQINHDLGFIKQYNFNKYDYNVCILDGQSLAEGWESKEISIKAQENCYRFGANPCYGLSSYKYNDEFYPLIATYRETPIVSATNTLSKLIPNRNFVGLCVARGAQPIANLSKDRNAKCLTAEDFGQFSLDSTSKTIKKINSSSHRLFIVEINQSNTYWFPGPVSPISEFSSKPIEGDNSSYYIGEIKANSDNYKDYFYTPSSTSVKYISFEIDSYEEGFKFFYLINSTTFYSKLVLYVLNELKNYCDRKGKTIGCPCVMWMQGESDSWNTTSYYESTILKLKNDIQNDIKDILKQEELPLFFTYLPTTGTNLNIQDALTNLSEKNNDTFLVGPVYPFPDYSNLHLSSNGYRWYGEYIGRSWYETLVLGIRDLSIVPVDFQKSSNYIKIKVKAKELPLVIDTYTVQEITNYGFQVFKNGTEISILSIQIFGDEIILNTTESLDEGVIIITYAGINKNDNLTRGTGNIRDSYRWKSWQKYWDDTEDTGFSNITYRPKDKEGNSLIGQYYPMQNWLINFKHIF